MKMLRMYSQLLLLISLCLGSLQALAQTRYAAAGGSYTISIVANHSVIAKTPTIGSDNNAYYLVAPANSSGIIINSDNSAPSGEVVCKVNYLQGDYRAGLDSIYAYHRLLHICPKLVLLLMEQLLTK